MRLHRMTFRGLGPFRDEQQVDFRDLASSGLFLLEGPTGSGKSTLIDALVFALYGDVAADAGHKDRLVSHYLPAGDVPFVELVFETNAGVYRVRRTPEHERPKKRGTGTVKAHATVNLTRLTSPDSEDGEVLTTRVGEADAEIRHAIGLNRDQFVGTVVLPQGEFASFLRAKVADRGEILQRIFRTDQYKRLQVALDDARKKAQRDRVQADEHVKVAVGGFVGAAGLAGELPGWDGDPASAEQLDGVLAGVLQDLVVGEAELAALEAAARAESDAARARRDERARRAGLRDRRRAAEQERAELDAREAAVRADAERVAAAERAGRVSDQLAAERSAATRAQQAAAGVAAARERVGPEARDLDEPALRDMREATDVQVGQLADLVTLEDGLTRRGGEIKALRVQHGELRESVTAVRARLQEMPDEREGLLARREERQAISGRGEQLGIDLEALVARHRKSVELEVARSEAAKAQRAVDRASKAAKQAQDQQARTRNRYLEGISAELARELRDGSPCQVCGSVEHPEPASAGDDHVTRDQAEAADAALAKADGTLRKREEALAQANVAVAALEGVVGGRTVVELEDEVAATRAALAAAQQAAQQVTELDSALSALDAERTMKSDELTRLSEQVATLEATIGAQQAALADDTGRVESAREGEPSVRSRVAALKAASKALGVLLEALAEHDATADELQRHRGALATALEREGFASAAEAESAALGESVLAGLRDGIAGHRERRLLNDAELADQALQDVDPAEEVDLAAAEQALQEATDRLDEAGKALGVAQTRLRDSDRAAASVRDGLLARAALIARTEPLIRVARLAVADSSNRLLMDLATYVLQQRFEAVVAAANDHLRLMSDGKLALVAHDEVEGRARRAGLGLRVVDLRTDRERPTGTLSGGETFYTALSLALGLAGVVTAEAGGVSLETLFVDEGFGSLDPDTLDDVMGVLTSLREGGRTVGVVSHVDEMKNRIAERISVRRDNDRGPSRLEVVA